MHTIMDFASQIVRFALRLVLVAAVAVFLVSLLGATLFVMLVVSAWALLTGRRPQPARIFGQFRQTSARYTRSAWQRHRSARAQDIVDVPADAVRETPRARPQSSR